MLSKIQWIIFNLSTSNTDNFLRNSKFHVHYPKTQIELPARFLACECSRLNSLLAAWDGSRDGSRDVPGDEERAKTPQALRLVKRNDSIHNL